MSLASCLYECEIWHGRTKPRSHSFLHRNFMFYIDLRELDYLYSALWLFGGGSLSLFHFKPSDHLPQEGPSAQLEERVKSTVRQGGVKEEINSVRLLTNVRFFGYVFNPVSFFFCFDVRGNALCCLVEVGNTFGEKKTYVLRSDVDGIFRDRQRKFFYVSPFTELEQDFLFDLAVPASSLRINVDTMDANEKVVSTYMRGKELALTDRNLLLLSLRYPWVTFQVIMMIHFHALLLWLKRIPYHRKEEGPEQQTAVIHPHKSLQQKSKG